MNRTAAGGLLTWCLMTGWASGAVPWHQQLSLRNGGYWQERVAITVTNRSAEPILGQPLNLNLAGLAGARLESLRVCSSGGAELLFDVRDPDGRPKRTGLLSGTDKLIIPVDCAAGRSDSFYVYAGNPDAWPVPDFLPARFSEPAEVSTQASLGVSIGEVEHVQFKPAVALSPKPGRGWKDWAEVRVRRFNDESGSSCLVRVNLREALALLPDVPSEALARVASGEGRELASYRLSSDLFFSADLPLWTEQCFQVEFQAASKSNGAAAIENYGRLLDSQANLIPNGSFEKGVDAPDQWTKPPSGGPHGIDAQFSRDARFGAKSLELTVRENAKGDWLGWDSGEILVKPGATYFLSGWLKAVQLQSWATIHAHFHDAKGALTKSGAMVSTQPTVSGDSDWVNSSGFFRAPADAATIQLHLTMNTQGTLRHDGVVLSEVVDSDLVAVHSSAPERRRVRLQVWEANPLVKMFPQTPPQSPAAALHVELAGNEYRAVELGLRAPNPTQVSVEVSSPKTAKGTELAPVKIERVGYVPVDYPSAYYSSEVPDWYRRVPQGAGSTDGWAGWWPDPLAPGSQLVLESNRTEAVWLTVHAPKGAAPGKYLAQVRLTPAAQKPVEIPLAIEVLPFALPEQGRLRAICDLRFGPGGAFGSGMDSPEGYRRWLRFIAEHRLGVNEIQPPPKFSYEQGRVTMDASGFDETARFCFDELGMNVAYTPDFFYMFGWAYPPKKLFGLESFTPEWTSALQQAYRLFTEHVRQKGWHDKFVYYVSDEPHFQHEFVVGQMRKLCALIHQVDASIPIYSSTWRHCAAWDDSLDLWGIGQYGCFPVEEMQRLQGVGKHMWFTCDGQMATDTPYLATERLLPYYCFKYGVSGFEFWGLAWWTYNPWQIGWHQFIRQSDEGKKYYWIRYPDGDGYLAYPGKPVGVDGPVSTIRLEQIRMGLEDYEALSLLQELILKSKAGGASMAQAERALQLAKDLVTIPNAGGLRSTEILPHPERVAEVRHAVNAALVHLLEQPR